MVFKKHHKIGLTIIFNIQKHFSCEYATYQPIYAEPTAAEPKFVTLAPFVVTYLQNSLQ